MNRVHKLLLLLGMRWCWLAFLAANFSIVDSLALPGSGLTKSFDEWKSRCEALPRNRLLNGNIPPQNLLPLPSYDEFEEVVSAFLESSRTGPFLHRSNWVGAFPEKTFFDLHDAYYLQGGVARGAHFQPFAQKLELPAGSEIFFRADLHGDIHSLIANLQWLNDQSYLKGFTMARTNFSMIFLGDYTDRGSYGIEVLYTIYRLKLANPDRVFFLRGNHEEVSLQARYGLLEEGRRKYGASFDPRKLIRAYDFFPAVLYLGSSGHFLQCNHGGIEPGFFPGTLLDSEGPLRFQLLGTLTQLDFFARHPLWLAADPHVRKLAGTVLADFKPVDANTPSLLGFVWNDFTILKNEPDFAIDPGRAFVYGQKAVDYLLQKSSTSKNKVHAIFRGHQHSSAANPMMRRLVASQGIYRHWQDGDNMALLPVTDLEKKLDRAPFRSIPPGSVWTFNVSPDSSYGAGNDYTFDAFGILQLGEKFTEWRLQVINIPLGR